MKTIIEMIKYIFFIIVIINPTNNLRYVKKINRILDKNSSESVANKKNLIYMALQNDNYALYGFNFLFYIT